MSVVLIVLRVSVVLIRCVVTSVVLIVLRVAMQRVLTHVSGCSAQLAAEKKYGKKLSGASDALQKAMEEGGMNAEHGADGEGLDLEDM